MRAVYLAGPITGQTFNQATDWRSKFQWDADRLGWQALSPMRGKDKFRMPGPLPSTFDEGKAAVLRDLHDIRRSEAVLINLEGAARVSIGTMAEMGYAHALNKFIIVVLDPPVKRVKAVIPDGWCKSKPEARFLDWKDVTETNPHDHVFVREMASQIVDSLDDALDVLGAL